MIRIMYLCLFFLVSSYVELLSKEDSIYIYFKGGTKKSYAVNDLRKITFQKSTDVKQGSNARVNVTIYPNPTENICNFDIIGMNEFDLQIVNELGLLVFTTKVKSSTDTNQYVWNCRNLKNEQLPSGNYFYRINSQNYQLFGKLLIIK